MSPADEDEDEEEEEEAAAPLREARRLLSSPELLSLSELREALKRAMAAATFERDLFSA